jgi:hypothetical protein
VKIQRLEIDPSFTAHWEFQISYMVSGHVRFLIWRSMDWLVSPGNETGSSDPKLGIVRGMVVVILNRRSVCYAGLGGSYQSDCWSDSEW